MSYITFNTGELTSVPAGAIGTWTLPATSFQLSQIITLQELGGAGNTARLRVLADDDSYITYTVSLNTDGAAAIQASSNFLYISGEQNFSQAANSISNKNGRRLWINRSVITTTSPAGRNAADGTPLYKISYALTNQTLTAYTTLAVVSDVTNQDVTVTPQPATEFIFTNPLSLCYDITVVNHATGATNTIHTPLIAADYYIDEDRYVVPFGGFMVVFRTNDPGVGTFIYFIDNDGNLVDQIDGGGIGYDAGRIDYRLVWAYDVEADLSVLKIFDGKNVRTHEFPFLASFYLSPFNTGECSKNLYIPFEVYDNNDNVDYLYISTPGGGLIDLDYESWYDNESFSAIHPTSDKILRLTDDGDGMWNALDVYTEDGIKINSLDLTGYGLNDRDDYDYYGTAGDFYTVLYNFEDNTVPYLFVAYRAATNTFATFTSTTAVDGYNENAQDFELYERNTGAGNVLSIIIGENFGEDIPGMRSYDNGGSIYWLPATGTSWLSYEINDGDPFQISATNDDQDTLEQTGAFGTYPLYVITSDTINDNLHTLLLLETGADIGDTGIATGDTLSVNTSCLGDYTYARIGVDAMGGIVSWQLYSDTAMPSTFTTTSNYEYRQEGGVIVVLDLDNSGNSWSWTTAAVNTVGDIIVPAATDSFELVNNNPGGYWNPWGYSTNGKQVLVDKDGVDHVVGFYFLTEDSTAWTYMPNAWDDGTGRAWEKGLNNFAFMTWNTGLFAAGGYVYMNYDIATGAFISGGTSEMLFGGNFGINAVGDRQSARTELPVSGDYEHNCFTAAGIVKVTTPSSYDIAFNDAYWSAD